MEICILLVGVGVRFLKLFQIIRDSKFLNVLDCVPESNKFI